MWGSNSAGQYDRLPALAADLVARQVSVIVAALLPAARAAKAATATIPIVFISGSDPIESWLVTSLSRPTENVTGVSVFSVPLIAKRLQLLHELIPGMAVVAVLVNSSNPNTSLMYETSSLLPGPWGCGSDSSGSAATRNSRPHLR